MTLPKRKLSGRKSPEILFLIFALSFGLIFVFATGPFQAPDEFTHYFRAYRLSTGSFLAEANLENLPSFAALDYEDHRYAKLPANSIVAGYQVPQTMEASVKLGLRLKANPSEKFSFDEWRNLVRMAPDESMRSFYPGDAFIPLIYLPQAFGIGIGRTLGLSPLAWLYLGRVANLGVWTLMIWSAIRLTPIFKSTFAVLALLPMSLFLAASLSYDAFTIGISFILIALILRLAFAKIESLSRWDWLLLATVSVAVSISKYVYGVILLSYLAIPVSKIGSRLKYYSAFAALFALNILAAVTCFQIAEASKYFGGAAHYSPQMAEAIAHPFHFFAAFFRSWTRPEAWQLARHFFGVLGWLDTSLHFMLQAYCALTLVLTAVLDHRRDVRIPILDKLIFGLAGTFAILLVFLGQYLTWTPPGHATILGVQGRYLIPISPLLFLLFYNVKFRAQDWMAYQSKVLPIYWTISLSWTTATLLVRYHRLPF